MNAIGVIMAAGKGTRMRSDLPKPIVPFKGKPIVQYIIDSFKEAGVKDVILIVGHGADQVEETIGKDVQYVLQKEQKGTAHAVMQVSTAADWKGKDMFVFVGDSPLISSNTIKRLFEHHNNTNAVCTFLTATFDVHLPYARIVRNEKGQVTKVVEEMNASPEEFKINEYLTTHFIFKADALFQYINEIQPAKKNGEYYLTDMIDIFLTKKLKVEVLKIDHYEELVGLNSPEDLAWAEKFYNSQNGRS